MPESVTREEVQMLVHNGAQLIEVLDARQYVEAHLAGAINIPLSNLDHKSTAALTHERPVILYCHDLQSDLSARAAWRLESLGYDNVCDYLAGKQDWLAYGLPIEGQLAEAVTAGRLAVREVPVCRLEDKLSELAQRFRPGGLSECVVVNEAGIVLGLLRKSMWEGAANGVTAEEAMESAPITFRPYARREEVIPYMEKKQLESALVTTADGKLLGWVRREDPANGAKS